MQAYVKTDVGLVRALNEDSYIFDPPDLFAVADGMGGHVAGEVASDLAVKTVAEYIRQRDGEGTPEELLGKAIERANYLIYQLSQAKADCNGMGTTFTVTYRKGNTLFWGHVGDSRAYLCRNNELRQLTQDHSLVWELVQSGNITKDEANNHPRRNILTRAVGTSYEVKVDTGRLDLETGDILLLCTDGLNGLVDDATIHLCIKENANDAAGIVEKLVEAAKVAGGHDNITVILFKNEAGEI